MKKLILSVTLVAACLFANAQAPTNVQNAQNLPTATGYGFEFKFQGTPTDNCSAGNAVWNCFSNPGYTVTFSGNNPVLTSDGTQGAYGPMISARLPVGNCNIVQSPTYPVDCSTYHDITMTVTSTVNVPNFCVMLGVDNSGYVVVDGGNTVDTRSEVSLVAGVTKTFTVTSPTHNNADVAMPMNKVLGLTFYMRGAGGASIATSVTITSIKIGDATVVSTGTTAEINNSLISVYPNPAKDQISVDLSSLNTSDASVIIMNANGFVVYEGKASNSVESINTSSFNKGMYMVQVSSGDKVSNKKIVIE